ncbi:MAG: hypothetical protein WCR13_10280 [Sphaerochaeta sp.]
MGIASLTNLNLLTLNCGFEENFNFSALADWAKAPSMVNFSADATPSMCFGHILYSLQVHTIYRLTI